MIRMATLYGTGIGCRRAHDHALLMSSSSASTCAFCSGWWRRAPELATRVLRACVYVLISLLDTTCPPPRTSSRGGSVGMVQGGTQALSARVREHDPRHKSSEFFAFFSVFERYAGVLGPAHLRPGLSAPDRGDRHPRRGAFFVIGAAILAFVNVVAGRRRPAPPKQSCAPASLDGRRDCPFRHPRVARAITAVFYRGRRSGAVPGSGRGTAAAESCQRLPRPAVIWATASRDVRFLAKSTLFNGAFAPILKSAGAIGLPPAGRRGRSDENVETFAAVQVLLRRRRGGLFPEGISHSTASWSRSGPALPGWRRRRAGWTSRGDGRGGLNFDRKTAFRSRVTVLYGQPFTVADLAGG